MNTLADHEAYLRAALHAAADSLEPRGDGLERIRARVQHARPRAVSWLLAAWDALRLRTPAALQDVYYALASVVWTAWDRFAPTPAPGKHRPRAQGWLRPLAAMAVAIFIIAAGTYVAIGVSTAVSPSSSSHAPKPAGPARPPAASPSSTRNTLGSGSGSGHNSASPTPTCTPSAAPSASPSTSSSPAASSSPTDTGTPATPPTTPDTSTNVVSATLLSAATPCGTPSGATTPAPSSDPSAGAGLAVIGQVPAALATAASPSPAATKAAKGKGHQKQ